MKKLKSNSGASLSLALLLFVVCAVVGSVILAAVTASSGRMSELAKMDQRYYSVTSAAELLKDTLDKQCITVLRKKKTQTVTNTVFSTGDKSISNPTPDDPYEFFMLSEWDGKTDGRKDKTKVNIPVSRNQSLLSDLVLDMIFGSGHIVSSTDLTQEDGWSKSLDSSTGINKTFYLKPASISISNVDLEVEVDMKYLNGSLTLTLKNTNDSADKYSIQMLFSADIISHTDRTTNNKVDNDTDSRIETVTTIEEKYDSVLWQLVDITTV